MPQYRSVREISVLYGMTTGLIYSKLKSGALEGHKEGKLWRVLDPEWEPQYHHKGHKGLLADGVRILRGIEVARILGINPRTLRGLASQHLIGYDVLNPSPYSARRYSVDDVRALIAKRAEGKINSKARVRAKAKREAMIAWAKQRLEQPVVETP